MIAAAKCNERGVVSRGFVGRGIAGLPKVSNVRRWYVKMQWVVLDSRVWAIMSRMWLSRCGELCPTALHGGATEMCRCSVSREMLIVGRQRWGLEGLGESVVQVSAVLAGIDARAATLGEKRCDRASIWRRVTSEQGVSRVFRVFWLF